MIFIMKRDYKCAGLITATISQKHTELSGDRTRVPKLRLMRGRYHSSKTAHSLATSQTEVNTERKVIATMETIGPKATDCLKAISKRYFKYSSKSG